jgi:hypothetical protein
VPNGNPDFDADVAEQWFAPIAGALLSFAQRHNLLVDRYYHDSPSWTFRFNNPRGGQASLSVHCNAGAIAFVDSSWHIDDYDRFTRYIRWRKPREVAKLASTMGQEIEMEFAAIVAVPLGQWNQVAEGYAQTWGRYTKDEFQKMTPKYPDPIL